jgi:hypothetical protein
MTYQEKLRRTRELWKRFVGQETEDEDEDVPLLEPELVKVHRQQSKHIRHVYLQNQDCQAVREWSEWIATDVKDRGGSPRSYFGRIPKSRPLYLITLLQTYP